MWEIIRKNKRTALLFFFIIGFCSISLGFIIFALLGMFMSPFITIYQGQSIIATIIKSGLFGAAIVVCFWGIGIIISYYNGNSYILEKIGAKEITHEMHPKLINIVEEMVISSNLSITPKIYAVSSLIPNAFSMGIRLEESSIIITTGLLKELNRNELQGVIAHEMSHIINHDLLYTNFAQILLDTTFSLGSKKPKLPNNKYPNSSSGEGFIIYILLYVVGKIAHYSYYKFLREREFLADATAARLTRYPNGLASALEKINDNMKKLSNNKIYGFANPMIAPLYILNPLQSGRKTHPQVAQRTAILHSMSTGADYTAYHKAYKKVIGKDNLIPQAVLDKNETITIKEPESNTSDSLLDENKSSQEESKFILCDCSIKIKITPEFKQEEVVCPHCGSKHNISAAKDSLAAVSLFKKSPFKDEIITAKSLNGRSSYINKPQQWELLSCDCGNLIQISPNLISRFIECNNCGKRIKVIKSSQSKQDNNKKELNPELAQEAITATAINEINQNKTKNKFRYIECDCNLKIKLPPGFNRDFIICPRCGRDYTTSTAEILTADKNKEQQDKNATTVAHQINDDFTYSRQTEGWETFICKCGESLQLSPVFKGNSITCTGCNKEIKILEQDS